MGLKSHEPSDIILSLALSAMLCYFSICVTERSVGVLFSAVDTSGNQSAQSVNNLSDNAHCTSSLTRSSAIAEIAHDAES